MKRTNRWILAVVLAAACAYPTSPGNAAEEEVTIKGLVPGATVHGPKFTKDDMKGKVVCVEFWGPQCGACMAMIPELAKLYDSYKAKGFHLIAVESQRSKYKEIVKLAKEKKIPYQVTVRGGHPGVAINKVPFILLFDREGKLAATELRGKELEKKIKALLSAKPASPGAKRR